jgi:hypothetical protein
MNKSRRGFMFPCGGNGIRRSHHLRVLRPRQLFSIACSLDLKRHQTCPCRLSVGMAFPRMECDFRVSKMLPAFGVAEMFPAVLRVEHRALTAQRAHGAVALNILHGDFPAPAHERIRCFTSGVRGPRGGTRQFIKNMENKAHPDSGTRVLWRSNRPPVGLRRKG